LYDILYKKAWLAIKNLLERLFESHEESVHMLSRMLLALEKLNPSIVIEWDHKMVDGDTTIF
jgi:hypothetical protein